MQEPLFSWDEDLGIATCILFDEQTQQSFYGTAICNQADSDMKSEKTGCHIAYHRAIIKALIFHRDCELKPMLKALNQLYYSMSTSKKFNSQSYENKMLQRQIRFLQNDLNTAKEMLITEKENLKKYIQEKDDFYKKIRLIRKGDENRKKE